ncbi:MAG: site-specific DNA-methyltransferase [Deltaproteobacteria bacterium]|nr:site-specific DNA-methyltransferase [Deltaproteobacteria bacterium]
MHNNPLPRIDEQPEVRARLLPFCRIKPGGVWTDAASGHRVACIDATDASAVSTFMDGRRARLAIQDPPYNLVAFETRGIGEYIDWSRAWVTNKLRTLEPDSSFYVWLGADQRDHFQPLPDFMILMREFPIQARSFITARNQRGYGTQKNWMAVRQELLYYVRGTPAFNIEAEYTDIPKTLRGYYKDIGGERTENLERGKGDTIRAGNVWIDIQQVFYRLQENVSGCYAQKPLKSTDRIIRASSHVGDLVIDFFAHSGTTLLAAELAGRRCYTADINPVFCEIAIRRLEHFRASGKTGWQNGHAFEKEMPAEALLALAGQSPDRATQPTLF